MNKNFLSLLSALACAVALALSAGCGGGGGAGGGGGGGGGGTRVQGLVTETIGLSGVEGITVDFYNSGGSRVGSATTNAFGVYDAAVSQVPTTVHIRNSSLSAAFYRTYRFNNKWYLPAESTCRAPITGIVGGVANSLATIQVAPAAGPPPPPPTGCN